MEAHCDAAENLMGGLLHDYEVWLEKLAPHAPTSQYHHNRTGEDNADAHMKRQVMGREVVVAITDGKLDFGPWEPTGRRFSCWESFAFDVTDGRITRFAGLFDPWNLAQQLGVTL